MKTPEIDYTLSKEFHLWIQNFSFDIKFELVGVEEKSYGEPFIKKILDGVLSNAISS